ncbi:energy transducer TonB [Flavobacterium sp. LS1R47]|uniref:Energy transducer TonB n=1 Tax=Flavobacterium frigoritolerans TaxID=2987686 RepID=A0A9X2YZK7_9FLAO|nr:energy transducer TonB [Flavobacterium frigoritolerans]MCV9932553.1 energy transducer TonB [Flavobacterium frigoritolerans]
MKFRLHYYFTIAFFLLVTTKSFSQGSIDLNKMIYMDSTYTEATAENYKYIRIVEGYYQNRTSYVFKDYYKSKILKMIGTSTEKDYLSKEGQFVHYYENGKKKSAVNYVKGKKDGKEYSWHENGNLKSELEYFKNKKGKTFFKVNNYWNNQNEQKVTSGNGDYEIADDRNEESGKIKNGFPDGIWKGKNIKSNFTFTENYENGELVSGISIDSLNIEHSYKVAYDQPVPKNGIETFYRYIAREMFIPIEARNKVYGKIYMTFIVDKEGNLTEPKIVKGIGYGLDESAISAIKGAKKWKPGLERGIPTRVIYSLPITIVK